MELSQKIDHKFAITSNPVTHKKFKTKFIFALFILMGSMSSQARAQTLPVCDTTIGKGSYCFDEKTGQISVVKQNRGTWFGTGTKFRTKSAAEKYWKENPPAFSASGSGKTYSVGGGSTGNGNGNGNGNNGPTFAGDEAGNGSGGTGSGRGRKKYCFYVDDGGEACDGDGSDVIWIGGGGGSGGSSGGGSGAGRGRGSVVMIRDFCSNADDYIAQLQNSLPDLDTFKDDLKELKKTMESAAAKMQTSCESRCKALAALDANGPCKGKPTATSCAVLLGLDLDAPAKVSFKNDYDFEDLDYVTVVNKYYSDNSCLLALNSSEDQACRTASRAWADAVAAWAHVDNDYQIAKTKHKAIKKLTDSQCSLVIVSRGEAWRTSSPSCLERARSKCDDFESRYSEMDKRRSSESETSTEECVDCAADAQLKKRLGVAAIIGAAGNIAVPLAGGLFQYGMMKKALGVYGENYNNYISNYSGTYNQYLNQCAIIGAECPGPSPMGPMLGTGGGGFGGGGFGMGGGGFGMGGGGFGMQGGFNPMMGMNGGMNMGMQGGFNPMMGMQGGFNPMMGMQGGMNMGMNGMGNPMQYQQMQIENQIRMQEMMQQQMVQSQFGMQNAMNMSGGMNGYSYNPMMMGGGMGGGYNPMMGMNAYSYNPMMMGGGGMSPWGGGGGGFNFNAGVNFSAGAGANSYNPYQYMSPWPVY